MLEGRLREYTKEGQSLTFQTNPPSNDLNLRCHCVLFTVPYKSYDNKELLNKLDQFKAECDKLGTCM